VSVRDNGEKVRVEFTGCDESEDVKVRMGFAV